MGNTAGLVYFLRSLVNAEVTGWLSVSKVSSPVKIIAKLETKMALNKFQINSKLKTLTRYNNDVIVKILAGKSKKPCWRHFVGKIVR